MERAIILCKLNKSLLESSTGCVRQNENPTDFKIVNKPLLVQKKTLHQQKALNLCYLEPEGQACSLKKVK